MPTPAIPEPTANLSWPPHDEQQPAPGGCVRREVGLVRSALAFNGMPASSRMPQKAPRNALPTMCLYLIIA